MAKYEFEWTDEQAQAVQELLVKRAEHGEGRLFFSNVAQTIEAQKPVPLPTKIGAVVRGSNGPTSPDRTFVCSGPPGFCWMESDGDSYSVLPVKNWTVLSEGVDL